MTESRSREICREYARCYKNILSFSAQDRIDELDAEAAAAGLKFEMTNRAVWMLPHVLVDPEFILVEA